MVLSRPFKNKIIQKSCIILIIIYEKRLITLYLYLIACVELLLSTEDLKFCIIPICVSLCQD